MIVVHRLVFVAAVGASIAAAVPGGAASSQPAAAQAQEAMSDTALVAALRADLTAYIAAHKQSEHVSAASLSVTVRGKVPLNVVAGTTEFGGHQALPASGSLWQIGSNTKAFTASMILQLEAGHALSIDDTVGKWLPQYSAWSAITIRRLLNMTSGIPTYDDLPAFLKATAAAPETPLRTEVLIGFAKGLPLHHGYYYSNTAYLLAQLIAEKAGHESYASQLRKRFFEPLGLSDAYYHADFLAVALRARMPAGYFFSKSVEPMAKFAGDDVRRWSVSWMQGAGGIVASTAALNAWVVALYGGRVLAPAQQTELESIVSMKSGKAIATTSPSDRSGFGLGVVQADAPGIGKVWFYEGGTMGFRVVYMYLPSSGTVASVGLNSSADSDAIGGLLFKTIYTTLRRAGRV